MLKLNRKIIPLLIASYLLAAAGNLSAATLTVTTIEDTNDSVCNSQCSLREAIEAAAPNDTIIFARQLRGGTIQLQSTLQIKRWITIDGPNKRRITIKGNNTFRIFHLMLANLGIGVGRVVNLDGLIIRDGYAGDGDGGGIYSDPTFFTVLNITNCAILNNTARRGGGVYVYNSGTFYLIDSTVAGNAATGDNSGAGLDLSRSTVRIMNSTISGNRGTSPIASAGGIRLAGSNEWFINSSTIADNSSSGTDNLSAGGVVVLNGIPGPVSNTIVAGNTGSTPDIRGTVGIVKNSLIGIGGSGFTNGMNGNIVGSPENPIDAQLGGLAENGSGLPTHALLSTSRAIDAGNNILSINRKGEPLEIDQRNYKRIFNSTVDIGSYEFNSQPFLTTSTITGQVTTAGGRGVYGARVSLRGENGEIKYVLTNSFGYYRFVNVSTDSIYTIESSAKGKVFAPQTVLVEESTELINFRSS